MEQKNKKSATIDRRPKRSSKCKVAKFTSGQEVQITSNSSKRPPVNAHVPNRDRAKVSMKKCNSQLLTRNEVEPGPFNSKQERTSQISVCKISPQNKWQLSTETSCSLKEKGDGEYDEMKKISIRHSRRLPLFPPVSNPLAYELDMRQSRSAQAGEGGMETSAIRTRHSGEEKCLLCPMKLSVVSLKLPNIA